MRLKSNSFNRRGIISTTIAICLSGAPLPAAAQHNAKWLFAGVVPSKDQQRLLDTLQKEWIPVGTDSLWKADLRKIRTVLTPTQQRVFDVNVQVDSEWTLYKKAVHRLWNDDQTPRGTLLRGFFETWSNYYEVLSDSLQPVSQTPVQMRQRWDADRQSIRAFLTPPEQQQIQQQCNQLARQASALATIQVNNPKRLFAGIVLSANQRIQLDTLQARAIGASDSSVWSKALREMRTVLTPEQQQVFDVNMTIDSAWNLYIGAVERVWGSQRTPRALLLRMIFSSWSQYYGAVNDSLQNVSQTPDQIRNLWAAQLMSMAKFLTPDEQQEMVQQLLPWEHEAAVLAASLANEPKRLFAGIVLTSVQQTQLTPVRAWAVGAPDSVWRKDVQEMRAVLTPKQQRVFDVNLTVDSARKRYATAIQQLAQTKGFPWGESIKTLNVKTWEHYRAASDSLQNVSQTPAQIQQRWDTDRQVLRDFLNIGERQNLDQLLR